MSGSKNLLELKSPKPVTPEAMARIREMLKPMLEATNCELLITDPSVEATLHHTSLDRLCTAIEGLVEVNQALLAYMVDLDGGAPESTEGQSLDG